MKKTSVFQSLKLKLTTLVCLLIFTTITGVSFAVYFTTIDRIESDLGKMARSIARTAAVQVDGDMHEELARNRVV
ncbi:MAG: hypothetical protein AB8G05_08955 [Oligoflexales bacterium]